MHYTLDLGGQARFGPDVTWVDTVDYSFDESRVHAFYRTVRRYYPALADGDLAPAPPACVPRSSRPAPLTPILSSKVRRSTASLVWSTYSASNPLA